jgi:hypothetical protein
LDDTIRGRVAEREERIEASSLCFLMPGYLFVLKDEKKDRAQEERRGE